MSDLSYEIEQLYIDGYTARQIANELECPLGIVLDMLESINVEDNDQEAVAEAQQRYEMMEFVD